MHQQIALHVGCVLMHAVMVHALGILFVHVSTATKWLVVL
jgi:hypothetical protein